MINHEAGITRSAVKVKASRMFVHHHILHSTQAQQCTVLWGRRFGFGRNGVRVQVQQPMMGPGNERARSLFQLESYAAPVHPAPSFLNTSKLHLLRLLNARFLLRTFLLAHRPSSYTRSSQPAIHHAKRPPLGIPRRPDVSPQQQR